MTPQHANAGAPDEVTPAMIKAGLEVFYGSMLQHEDYCLSPREEELREMISSIFRSMEAVKPERFRKST